MRFLAVSLGGLVATLLLPGCGYIHFGRLEKVSMAGADAALAAAYADLSTEHKILKQELALARRESDALRAALDRSGGAASSETVARLSEAGRELASLRTSQAKLQSELAALRAAPGGSESPRAEEPALAAAPRDSTALREENTRLRGDLERLQRENAALGDQLKDAVARHEQTRQTVDMLNVELLAQKQARTRAEQSTLAARAQLDAVLARSPAGSAGNLAAARESTAASTATLQIIPSSPAMAPLAELRLDTDRLRQRSEPAAAVATAAPPPRTHVVQEGETLETIAARYYGTPERWPAIYDANRAALGAQKTLRTGQVLHVP